MSRALMVLALLLTGCSVVKEEEFSPIEPIMEPTVVKEPIASERCGDDGIGGTGCQIN
jgi:hypothetical protein